MTVQNEIERATSFGQKLEDIIVATGSVRTGESGDRDKLLLAYWSLSFDYSKSILALMRSQYHGGAFALLRPLIEALVRSHVVLMGSDDDVAQIKADTYRMNFAKIGAEIDGRFGLDGFFDRLLNGSKGALHSFTHSGFSQLGRRFSGNDLQARYSDGEILEVIHTSCSAIFMVTNLVANRFGLAEKAKEINDLFLLWGSE